MASPQRQDRPVHALAALLLQPLLLLLLRSPVTPGITCPTPMSVEHADIRVKSYNVNSRERYVCNSGFKRKAGTSSLTECMFNETTNTTYWTTPNLKCIRDPSLSHRRPVSPSTVVTARVTPQPESFSPPGKEPAALSPKSFTTVATQTAIVRGSQLTPPQLPSTGTTGLGSPVSSQAPAQTTAKTLECTPSASLETPGAYPHSSRVATVAVSTSAALLCGLSAVCLLAWYIKSRHSSWPPGTDVEMETTEAIPMTAGTISREEDTGTYPHNL